MGRWQQGSRGCFPHLRVPSESIDRLEGGAPGVPFGSRVLFLGQVGGVGEVSLSNLRLWGRREWLGVGFRVGERARRRGRGPGGLGEGFQKAVGPGERAGGLGLAVRPLFRSWEGFRGPGERGRRPGTLPGANVRLGERVGGLGHAVWAAFRSGGEEGEVGCAEVAET